MIALLRKDLRLSADALLPWTLIVIGVSVGGLAILRLPGTVAPRWTGLSSASELMYSVAILVAVSTPFVAAAVTALVLHGDRRHGAAALMGTLPIATSRRFLAKATAIAIAWCLLIVAVLGLEGAGTWLEGSSTSALFASADVLQPVALGSAIAIGLTVASGAFVRTPLHAVLVALILGVAGIGLGILGHGAVIGSLLHDYRVAIADAGGSASVADTLWLDGAAAEAMAIAAVTAVGATACAAGIIGLVGMAGPRRPRWSLMLLAVSMVVPIIAGVISTSRTIDRTVTQAAHPVAIRVVYSRTTDPVIAESISQRHGEIALFEGSAWEELREGQRRVRLWPDAQRTTHPIAVAIREGRDLSTLASAERWLAMSVDSLPDRFADALTAVERYPDSTYLRSTLHGLLTELAIGADATPTPGSAWAEYRDWFDRTNELREAWVESARAPERNLADIREAQRAWDTQRLASLPRERLDLAVSEALVARLRAGAESDHPDAARMGTLAERLEALNDAAERPNQ